MKSITGTLLFWSLIGTVALSVSACGSDSSSDNNNNPSGCTAEDCSGHGQCSGSGEAISCQCESGYTGARCDQCTTGYTRDGAGMCAPAKCSDDYCSGHGTCDDSSGAATCTCEAGFSGQHCDGCEPGMQDKDHDGHCTPSCIGATDVNCHGHGSCDDSNGTAACKCQTGYTGADCTACAAGYHGNADGSCTATCAEANLTCNHGHCDDTQGSAACACDAGYTGNDCTACASGFQDNDHNGSCLADCSGAGLNCEHGHCADTTGTASCQCESGYTNNAQGECVPQAPGYTCQNPATLSLTTASVSGTTAGAGDEATGSCQTGGSAEDFVYQFHVGSPMHVRIGSMGYDTVLYLRSSCDTASSELQCNDNGNTGDGSLVEADLQAGDYYLFVDGANHATGGYTLSVSAQCATGYVLDSSSGNCVADPCNPNPCTASHQHVCQPNGASYTCGCDYGSIPDTAHPGTCIVNPANNGSSCATAIGIPLSPATGTLTGTNSGASHQDGSCGGDGPEKIYSVQITEPTMATLTTSGYDTVMYLRSSCASSTSEVACNDDNPGAAGSGSTIAQTLQPGTYAVVVDSYGDSGGSYTLNYSFRTNPCSNDPCPGVPECQAASDWSSYQCVCPAGTIAHNGQCVDDPCDPNACASGAGHRNKCVADLDHGTYTCGCAAGFIDDPAAPGGACKEDPNAKQWSFFVYMNADNNLESDGYDDIAEMERAGSNANVQIVVLLDSYSRDGGKSRKLLITQNNYTMLQDLGELDMSDWHTLRDFGVWAVQNYPARHTALIMWDHGSGWTKKFKGGYAYRNPFKGFSNDEHGTYEEISVAKGEYSQALAAITAAAGHKLDMVGFDACLMGMWEVAESSAPYANYLVASEETIPAAGWSYDDFLMPLVAAPQTTPDALGTKIVDTYQAETTDNATLALVSLDTMGTLRTKLNAFASALIAHPEIKSQVRSARSSTQAFYESDNRDLYDFVRRVKAISGVPSDVATAADAVIAQLGQTIVRSEHQGSEYANAHGMAIYLPSSGVDSSYTTAAWCQNSTWDEFISSL